MAAVKTSGTTPELVLGRAMWELGLRYRKQAWFLPGTPDFVFLGSRLAVFCDGAFWHGKQWQERGFVSLEDQLNAIRNGHFWKAKIRQNMARDDQVNNLLTRQGWQVLRFLDSEINADSRGCAETVAKVVQDLRTRKKALDDARGLQRERH